MFSSLHVKYIQDCIKFFQEGEAIIIRNNLSIFEHAVVSPDSDYPDLFVPKNLISMLPKNIQDIIVSTSIGKWEHCLPLDFPHSITMLLKAMCRKAFNVEFRYADEAIPDWYNQSIACWRKGDIEKSLFHLGRTCHLIQDLCVPMHCQAYTNIVDAYNLMTNKNPNHNAFEEFCEKAYTPYVGNISALNINFEIPKFIVEIATISRTYSYYCDGISCVNVRSAFLRKILQKIVKLFVEDYSAAAELTNSYALICTVRIIQKFFYDINNNLHK